MEVILKCLESLTKEIPLKDNEGLFIGSDTKYVKRDFVTKMSVDIDDIKAHKEHYNEKGMLYKNRCIVHINGFGNLIVKHSYKELSKIKEITKQSLKIYGFKRK